MNNKTPFKERVRQVVISCAQIYKQYYMEYEYLVCSEAFKNNKYYKFYATKDNYLHLTGVHSNLKPAQFFNKCLDGTLSVTDFDFIKKGQTESEVKGIVRKKIQVLPFIQSILEDGVMTEESFSKGQVECSFATSTIKLTIGFTAPGRARPKTLLNGNMLKNPQPVDLILRKNQGSLYFSEIVVGDMGVVKKYKEIIAQEINLTL